MLSEREVQNCENAWACKRCTKKEKPAESSEEEELEKQKAGEVRRKEGCTKEEVASTGMLHCSCRSQAESAHVSEQQSSLVTLGRAGSAMALSEPLVI